MASSALPRMRSAPVPPTSRSRPPPASRSSPSPPTRTLSPLPPLRRSLPSPARRPGSPLPPPRKGEGGPRATPRPTTSPSLSAATSSVCGWPPERLDQPAGGQLRQGFSGLRVHRSVPAGDPCLQALAGGELGRAGRSIDAENRSGKRPSALRPAAAACVMILAVWLLPPKALAIEPELARLPGVYVESDRKSVV